MRADPQTGRRAIKRKQPKQRRQQKKHGKGGPRSAPRPAGEAIADEAAAARPASEPAQAQVAATPVSEPARPPSAPSAAPRPKPAPQPARPGQIANKRPPVTPDRRGAAQSAAGRAVAVPAKPAPAPSRTLQALFGALDAPLQILREQPQRLWLWLVGIYAALWLVVALAMPGLPADGYDMLVFGKEWQLGYPATAPLAPWLAQIAFVLTGQWLGSQAVLAIGAVVLTLVLVRRLAADMIGAGGAALAVALTLLVYQFGPPVLSFNPATAALPIFVGVILTYRRAVRDHNRLSWALFGASCALLIAANHSAIALIVVLALHLAVTQEGRSRIASAGPAIAAGVALLLLSPHLVWLAGASRPGVAEPSGVLEQIVASFGFLFGQLSAHLALLVVPLLALLPKPLLQDQPVGFETGPAAAFDRALILAAAIGPSLLIFAGALFFGIAISPYAGGGIVPLSALALVLLLPRAISLRAPRLATVAWLLVLVGLPFGTAISMYTGGGSGVMPAELYPAQALSNAMQTAWKSRTTRPLEIVTGSIRQAGFVALHASPRPSVFIDADFAQAPWITPERLKASGTLVVWATDQYRRTDELPKPYRNALPGSQPAFGTLVLPLGHGRLQAYGWAMLLPNGETPQQQPEKAAPQKPPASPQTAAPPAIPQAPAPPKATTPAEPPRPQTTAPADQPAARLKPALAGPTAPKAEAPAPAERPPPEPGPPQMSSPGRPAPRRHSAPPDGPPANADAPVKAAPAMPAVQPMD